MDYKYLIWAIGLLLPLGGFVVVRSKIRRISREFFGTSNVMEGIRAIEQEGYNRPFSVSGGTNIYLPMIKKDFPDFEYTVVSKKVEEFMLAYFDALEKQTTEPLRRIENTEAVKTKIQFEIDDMKSQGLKTEIDGVRTNGISIWDYIKSTEVATILFQISLGYKYKETKETETENGVAQLKYEVSMSYLFEDYSQESFVLNCKNCGSPVKTTNRYCEYCGSGIVRNIEMVWRISGFTQTHKQVWPEKRRPQ